MTDFTRLDDRHPDIADWSEDSSPTRPDYVAVAPAPPTAPAKPSGVASIAAPMRAPVVSSGQDVATVPFADIPRGVWRMFGAAWAIFFGALWIAFGGQLESAFMVAVSTGFALIYFATPKLLVGFGRDDAAPVPRIRVVETLTGPLSVTEAAVQILLLPVALAVGMAVIVLVVR